MWSPVFRSQIQTYYPTCLLTFAYFRDMDQAEPIQVSTSIFKLMLVLSLPFFSLYQLRTNLKMLEDAKFKKMYGSLY